MSAAVAVLAALTDFAFSLQYLSVGCTNHAFYPPPPSWPCTPGGQDQFLILILVLVSFTVGLAAWAWALDRRITRLYAQEPPEVS